MIAVAACMLGMPVGLTAKVTVENPRTDHRVNPRGIVRENPVFTWTIGSDKAALHQTGFEIAVASSASDLTAG